MFSGDVSLLDITFTLNGTDTFTLACISTGGPATTVQWTRDSTTVAEGNQTVLNDPVTALYTHTLTVTGSLAGLYTCTVANNKPSNFSASYTVEGITLVKTVHEVILCSNFVFYVALSFYTFSCPPYLYLFSCLCSGQYYGSTRQSH